jgi:hypothetical protein
VIRIYDEAGNMIETHEQAGEFKEWWDDMTVGEVLGFIAINAVLIAALQWLATTWLRARLEASIRHGYNVALANLQNEYDRQMELFQFDQRRRERAAMIAELFAEWVPAESTPSAA